jgi:uncharacterized membrane protein
MLFRSARKTFLERIDRGAIEAATREAEKKTTGEIRVSILPGIPGALDVIARKVADRLRMTATKERNGVLILVVPAKRKFIVWGDQAIHEKAGPEFFAVTAGAISERFRTGDFTGGLLHGIETVGRELATHFPAKGPHDDQLPNDVDQG